MPTPPPSRALPPELLEAPVLGVNLSPGTLRDQLDAEGTLLVFLRHFGCIFCKETVAELRAASESDPGFPKVLVFFQGSPTEGRAFLRRHWRDVAAIADPELRFYEAFGLERGGLLRMFGPGVWRAHSRAAAKGHTQGRNQDDIWRMPGVFFVRDDQVYWHHDFRHAGDLPDFTRIPTLVAGAPGV